MIRYLGFIMAMLLTCGIPLLAADKKPPYPPSRVDKIVEKLHGVDVADPYRWLEDSNHKDVKDWTEKQNQFTKSILDKLPGRDKIKARFNELMNVGALNTPRPVKGRYFYTKRDGKQNQPILYVRLGRRGKDRVLVDPNQEAKDGTVSLDWWFPSRDGKLLAFGLSKDGSEQSTLFVLNVDTGKKLTDVIPRTRYTSLAWLPDGKSFYYTRYPTIGSVPKGEENYNRHVFFHTLGTDPAKDPKVFGEGRPKEDMNQVGLSPNGRWLVVSAFHGWAKSEVFFKDLTKAGSQFVPLVEKINALFNVVVRDKAFFLHTNHQAPRYQLFRVNPLRPQRDNWTQLLRQKADVLEGVVPVGNFLVADYMRKASSRLKLLDQRGKLIKNLRLPALGTLAGIGASWNGNEFFYGFQSFTFAPAVYRVNLKTKKTTLWQKLSAGIDSNAFEVKQVFYPSKDGTKVSMFLSYKKGLKLDGNNPTLLYAYGGFNISLTPSFNASRFQFLEKGGVMAIANLRGGGEFGEEWHQAGMLGKKQNVFDDFLAAAQYLIKEKYTSSQKLAILGGSNGGLLMGAAITQRPDLFRAVVCAVPLLDMVRYHRFLIARLWIPEYGSADKPEDFHWLYAYSPYHRVKDGTAYPAMLITAAESDSRVDPLHARKMAARLQAATSSSQPIMLRVETKAGHGAGKPRDKVVEELTDTWSFLFWQLGVKP